MSLTPSERTKKWREENPEKFHKLARTLAQRYREKNPEKARESRRRWQINNPDKMAEYSLNWRTTRIQTGNGYIKVNRSPKPDSCMVCGVKGKKMDYHHWDDNHPCLGLYLCIQCHMMAEKVDKGFHIIYLQEKEGMVLIVPSS